MKSGEGIEASSLGWKAGEWPTSFVRCGIVWYRSKMIMNRNEFGGFEYATLAGDKRITVFND